MDRIIFVIDISERTFLSDYFDMIFNFSFDEKICRRPFKKSVILYGGNIINEIQNDYIIFDDDDDLDTLLENFLIKAYEPKDFVGVLEKALDILEGVDNGGNKFNFDLNSMIKTDFSKKKKKKKKK